VFGRKPSQMLGIPREVIEHHLKIYLDARLVQQKPQKQSIERQNFIHGELKKLLEGWSTTHGGWPTLLSSSRLAGNFGCASTTSLNKACPNDPFPLIRIDQIMDSTFGCDLLCFLDAYFGFHQIPMSREDEEHITFITVDGLFCYVSMPYGLKNALPTFVCAMHKTFRDLIRDLVEVYVYDIVVKIKLHSSLLDNLVIIFVRLRSMYTMLNLDKCVFRVSAGKLLGSLVLHWGIEANPDKIKAIEEMRPPVYIKDV
jgi:hypothetical protein